MRTIGASAGAVLWFGVLTICTAAIVLMLTYAPHAVARCALIAAPVGTLALIAL
jgi:hypothetical protein